MATKRTKPQPLTEPCGCVDTTIYDEPSKPRGYGIGPYTAIDRDPLTVAENIQYARRGAEVIAKLGGWVVCPHLMSHGIEHLYPPREWLCITLAELQTCDFAYVYSTPERVRNSTGSMTEIADCKARKLPLFWLQVPKDLARLRTWLLVAKGVADAKAGRVRELPKDFFK